MIDTIWGLLLVIIVTAICAAFLIAVAGAVVVNAIRTLVEERAKHRPRDREVRLDDSE